MFDQNSIFVENEKAAKMRAKNDLKLAAKQMKYQKLQDKKDRQEGVYKKIGPFIIKTWIKLAAVLFFLILSFMGNYTK